MCVGEIVGDRRRPSTPPAVYFSFGNRISHCSLLYGNCVLTQEGLSLSGLSRNVLKVFLASYSKLAIM